MHKIILLRHGLSAWNSENRFTGWEDVDLSPEGISEAHRAAELLKRSNITFDVAFTSVLKRAIRTLWIVLDDMNMMWVPVHNSWRLNERHYGMLQGLNKDEVKNQYGEEQFKKWRRGYDVRPPALEVSDPRNPKNDPKYHGLTKEELPLTESLKNTGERFLPYWQEKIVPELKSGKTVLIVAHGNLIRALVKELDQISDEDITELNIATGDPLVYELDSNLKPIKSYYLEERKVPAGEKNV